MTRSSSQSRARTTKGRAWRRNRFASTSTQCSRLWCLRSSRLFFLRSLFSRFFFLRRRRWIARPSLVTDSASDSDSEEDEGEAGAVVASHPLLGVAPPARKRRRAAAAPSNGVPRDVAVAAAAAGLDASASSSSDSDSSSDDSDSDDDDDGAPNVPADLLAAAAAAGAY